MLEKTKISSWEPPGQGSALSLPQPVSGGAVSSAQGPGTGDRSCLCSMSSQGFIAVSQGLLQPHTLNTDGEGSGQAGTQKTTIMGL